MLYFIVLSAVIGIQGVATFVLIDARDQFLDKKVIVFGAITSVLLLIRQVLLLLRYFNYAPLTRDFDRLGLSVFIVVSWMLFIYYFTHHSKKK